MLSGISLGLLSAAWLLNVIIPLVRNIRLARASGIPYVVIPWFHYNRFTAMFMYRTVLRLCNKCLGPASPTSWRTLVTAGWQWKLHYTPFAVMKTDTFLTVAPGGIMLHVADADVATQIIARPVDFPKAAQLYRSINVYGENVVSSEGATWRHHRKLMSPVFSESNNQLVWRQSLNDARAMLSGWLSTSHKTVTTLAQDTMLLSLSVIGRAGLGQTIEWPSVSVNNGNTSEHKEKLLSGHQMSFTVAMTTLLRNIFYVAFLPEWFLRESPFKIVQQSYLAYTEWGQYLREIVSSKRTSLAQSQPATKDLLTQLLEEHEQPTSATKTAQPHLSDSEILGNLFVLLLAGHETSATSIHFSLALLAIHPTIQREVQTELDQIFTNRDPSQWNYTTDFPKLVSSKLAAVVHEQLRLYAPIGTVPKCPTTAQPLRINGRECIVPADAIVRVNVQSLHRNPACWPPLPGSQHSQEDDSALADLGEFRPSRWFLADGKSWYNPPKGTYLPFSDGARACLGKRFAMVEILAVLALILRSHSIELAVDASSATKDNDDNSQTSSPSDQDQDQSAEQLKEAWRKARDEAKRTLREKLMVIITLQLAKGTHIPVRAVERGKERFIGFE